MCTKSGRMVDPNIYIIYIYILAGECRAFLASGSEASQTALTRRWVSGAEKPRHIYTMSTSSLK